MTEYLFGQRQVERHEHGGPDDRVEAHDLLADEMHVGGPELFKLVILVVAVAERGDVVGQRVDPHVDDVAGVEGDGDAP